MCRSNCRFLSFWSCCACMAVFVLTAGRAAVGQDALGEHELQGTAEQTETSLASPTAEDMLKALRRSRPMNAVIVPESGVWSGDGSPRRKLWPEGWAVVDRSGRLTRDREWWAFAFYPDEGDLPIRLIPNANLEVLVRTAVHATNPVNFVISGQATVYKDRNYLLVRSVMRDRTTRVAPSRVNIPATAANMVATDAPAEDVLNVLKNETSETDPMDTRTRLAAPEAASAVRPLRPDGANVINRPARVARRGSLYQLVFESDHPDNPEPPLTMLPNQHMLRMVNATNTKNLGVVFIVSGEITQFQGENFILVRAATRRLDSGNFRK